MNAFRFCDFEDRLTPEQSPQCFVLKGPLTQRYDEFALASVIRLRGFVKTSSQATTRHPSVSEIELRPNSAPRADLRQQGGCIRHCI